MRRSTVIVILVATLVGLLPAPSATAQNICGTSQQLDFSNSPILPFGGEYLGVMTSVGEIVGAHVQIQFTTTGTFDAADVGVGFQIIDASGSVGIGFSGAQLGWSGQGTFTHEFDSAALNGLLYPGAQPFSSFLLFFSNLDFDNGPITGNFDQLVYTIDFGACPPGDVNHDMNVNVVDLLAVITAWGSCPFPPAECPADVASDGAVNVNDLLTVITNWGEFCPKCS